MALPEVRLLQAAIAVARDLNFSRASERLHIGQSTLSKQVYELETQLGFRLFNRNHQTVEVTDAGRAFVEEAREAVLHMERAISAATAVFNGADEILNLGKSAYTEPFLVSTLLSIRLPLFPGMRTNSGATTPMSSHARSSREISIWLSQQGYKKLRSSACYALPTILSTSQCRRTIPWLCGQKSICSRCMIETGLS